MDEPIRVGSVRILSGPEGEQITRFGPDEQYAGGDPYVLQRLVPEEADAPAEVITRWAPTQSPSSC